MTPDVSEQKITETEEYECSSCGADLVYKPGTLKLKCPYCGTENEIPKDFSLVKEHILSELPLMPALSTPGFGIQSKNFKCDNCGAIQSVEPKVIATKCAFCGSGAIFETSSNPRIIRPHGLVPFAMGVNDAQSKYRDWLKRLWFRPSDLKKTAAITTINGIYTPFFTFDAQAESDWSGWRGEHYYTTDSDGNRHQHTRWEYRSGHHSWFYDDILVNASRGLPESILKKIYPYDLRRLVGYSTEFLAGFSAEEYSKDPGVLWHMARQRVIDDEYNACSMALDGDTQRGLHVSTQIINPAWKHVLLPVFAASYLYKDKRYNFLVNGQTGEVQGEAPLSWAKIAGLVLGVTGIIVLIVLVGYYMGWF